MKRFIIYILVLTAIASCVNSDGYSVEEDYNGNEIFTSPLIIELGSPRTKSFDESLNWHWKNSDVIYGYQVAGSNIVNSLSKVDGNHFQTENFRYTSQEPTTFHFIYAGDASLNISRSEERAIKQDSLQSGIWNPVLVGSAVGKLFNEVMNQESVIKMEHLSAALEVRLWKRGVDKGNLTDGDRKNVIYAELSSDSEKFLLDIVPSYSQNGEVSYNVREQEELKGDRVKIEGINKSVVVFNVAPHLEDYPNGALKLVLEDADDGRYRIDLPAISFGAGERTVVNVEWNGIAKADLPSGKEFNSKVNSFLSENENVTKIKFVANSPVKSEYALVENSVFFVKNDETLEIHTANEQFNANGDCSNMFAGKSLGKFTNLERITSIEFGDSFNTEGVVNMYEMFSNCTNLLSLDLSCFSTTKVTNMSRMFASCNSLTDLDISSFDVHSVENLSSMFMDCYGLQSLDLSHFSTQKVTNMDWMFCNCFNLSVLDVSSFNTENVTTMHDMFSWCSSLTSLDLSSFDTQKVTDMSYMFLGCSKLDSLDLSNFSFVKGPDVSYMFSGLGELSEYKPIPVYVSAYGKSYIETKGNSYINGNYATLTVKETAYLPDGETFNSTVDAFMTGKGITWIKFITNSAATSEVALVDGSIYLVQSGQTLEIHTAASQFMANSNCSYMFNAFEGYDNSTYDNILNSFGKIQTIDFGDNFNTQNVTNMGYMFFNCTSLTSLDLSNFNTQNVTIVSSMFSHCTSLTSLDVSNFNTQNVTKMGEMFSYCTSLTSMDLSNFNTQNVTSMDYMFYECRSLTSLDVSNFDTQNVTDISSMFAYCSNLTSLDVSNFNTRNVTDMNRMFFYCSSLTSLDVSNFNTQNVKYMYMMFEGCSSLTSLDVSNFDTRNVTNMGEMFSWCTSLTSLDLSNFATQNVTDMGDMFYECSSLTSLDVSNFDTQNVTNMEVMFTHCLKLTSLDLSNFTFGANPKIKSMFYNTGGKATNKPIPIYVSADGKSYIETEGNSRINSSYATLIIKTP